MQKYKFKFNKSNIYINITLEYNLILDTFKASISYYLKSHNYHSIKLIALSSVFIKFKESAKMSNFEQNQKEENLYLQRTLEVIERELEKEKDNLENKTRDLIASRREMWEEGVHFSDDVDRIPETIHYLSEVSRETRNYSSVIKSLEKYNKMLNTPYFGRFDFAEKGYDTEKIYVGTYNLIDQNTDEIYIYDWRAPISSIFYRCELGKGSYKSPIGIIEGGVLLKRQYKIEKSKLKYFFDSSIKINDEILQEVLSKNSSQKMRSIVETIQKEQDIIIRDMENELLIVQGVAGSGKTSIALHRIAFLLYEGLSSKLSTNNIIIISPNGIFSKYISSVLPELGEENVEQITFNEIIEKIISKEYIVETRETQLEKLILSQEQEGFMLKKNSIEFKGSLEFVKLLDRLIEYYEKYIIDFQDIYYDGKVIEIRQNLRNFFLDNKINMPIAKRLKRMENMILNKIHPLRSSRLEKIEKVVERCGNHILEIKSFARLMAVKEAKVFMEHLRGFTKVDYMELYKLLFKNKRLFFKLVEGLKLPYNIEEIINYTEINLLKNNINYEDCAPLIYMKLKLEGNDSFSEIKQVVIDEAQDYYPLQYQVFKLLFKEARYTVLGDFNQSLERSGNIEAYDSIARILNKRKTTKLFMKKSFRASYEINSFTNKLLKDEQEIISFERHESEPRVIFKENIHSLDHSIAEEINLLYKKGYESISVICKTKKEAKGAEERLRSLVEVKMLKDTDSEIKKGVLVMPSYLAKGLEFDAVIMYNASDNNYKSEIDRRLLYVACTRALHHLTIYYTGEKSVFIK